ncbi:hypothetical protein [Novosphingobium pentaromativorans]|uniref:Uncharacterized protein n=1 Tax=Novosphingobium pentaromativorans US6-1 TaxID=1088721 RepID=G6EHC2_9SPHN|nr:hypothetical protein [Novosphingobium pentaromativorans]EHJ59411.1 hypothetical protein NSU_3743 [Novosphingobium pentaromativorans US6-1]
MKAITPLPCGTIVRAACQLRNVGIAETYVVDFVQLERLFPEIAGVASSP